MEINDYFRKKVWYIINTLQANQLYVHSSTFDVVYEEESIPQRPAKKSKGKKKSRKKTSKKTTTKKLPVILSLCTLNALVPNSAMLLIGGHGGGKTSLVKYLGRMLTGMSMAEAEESILRAHPQLTEEKIIATLDIKKLMKDGEEEVIWRKFATGFWKIIDEVNRCSPYTQNILLSLLAEGKLKYYDTVLDISKYCLYATLNPNDVGTFEMSAPFLDRFGISLPISMPQSQDLSIILESPDEKLGGYDELIQIPAVLSEQDLLSIWYDVGKIECSQEAAEYIQAIIREYTICIRIDKGNSNLLKPSTGLCANCHYNVPKKVPCCNSEGILSVRVAKDLLRYGRALAWLLGQPVVKVPIISAIAPYVISHRAMYSDRVLNVAPFWGSKYKFTAHILDLVQNRFRTRKKAYQIIDNLRHGRGSEGDLPTLKKMAEVDLIVQQDLLPLGLRLADEKYQSMVDNINKAYNSKNVANLALIRAGLLKEMDFPNRGELIASLNSYLKTLTLHTYNCTQELWDAVRITVDGIFPKFTEKLKKTTEQRGTYRLKTEDCDMEINITGTQPLDIVNFNFYGGDSAAKLNEEILEYHGNSLKTMEELIADNLSVPKEEKKEKKERVIVVSKEEKPDEDIFDEDFFN